MQRFGILTWKSWEMARRIPDHEYYFESFGSIQKPHIFYITYGEQFEIRLIFTAKLVINSSATEFGMWILKLLISNVPRMWGKSLINHMKRCAKYTEDTLYFGIL